MTEIEFYNADDVPDLMFNFVSSRDEKSLLQSVSAFRKLVTVGNDILDLLSHDNPDIVFEAVWTLSNIASTNQASAVVDCYAVSSLVKLLKHQNLNIRKQTMICLGNVANHSPTLRDEVLRNEPLDFLLENIIGEPNDSTYNHAVATLLSFCGNIPGSAPDLELIAPAIPYIVHIITNPHGESSTFIRRACWALYYLSCAKDCNLTKDLGHSLKYDWDRKRRFIEAVMTARSPLTQENDIAVVETLVNLVENESTPEVVVIPALLTLSNFAYGSREQTQKVIDADIMRAIKKFYKSPNHKIQGAALMTLSGIAYQNMKSTEKIVGNIELLNEVLSISMVGHVKVREKAMLVIMNLIENGTEENITVLHSLNAIKYIEKWLEAPQNFLLNESH